jgi:hypothetical protein
MASRQKRSTFGAAPRPHGLPDSPPASGHRRHAERMQYRHIGHALSGTQAEHHLAQNAAGLAEYTRQAAGQLEPETYLCECCEWSRRLFVKTPVGIAFACSIRHCYSETGL